MTQRTSEEDVILTRYADGPTQLTAAIASLTEADLDTALGQESWTIRQILYHVVDGDDIFKACIKIALGNDHAVFDLQWYWDIPQTRWADLWAYTSRAIGPSLTLYSANHCYTVQLIRAIPGAWERSILIRGTILKEQRTVEEQVTVGQIIEQTCDHLTGHIEDILRIRRAHDL